jgi:hypothetical protein
MNSIAVHLQRFLGHPHSGNGEAHSDLTVVTGRLSAFACYFTVKDTAAICCSPPEAVTVIASW